MSDSPLLTLEELAGEDIQMRRILRVARPVAASAVSVMIQGPSGTGKGFLARALHSASGRSLFVAHNCTPASALLTEGELLTHKLRPIADSLGQDAHGVKGYASATLFLDEIGDLSLEEQAQLLRVLKKGEVASDQGYDPTGTAFRVISTSHHDLRSMILHGLFRVDLYHRLNGFTFELPRLAERSDKEQLICKRLRAADSDCARISIEEVAFQSLLDYEWPGNMRELANVVRTARAICEGGVIRLRDLPAHVHATAGRVPGMRDARHFSPISAAHREVVVQAIRDSHGNMSSAASALQVSRNTLYRHCRRLGIPLRATSSQRKG
jgi:transcriptional regulator of acetoin/glycerol metabolism